MTCIITGCDLIDVPNGRWVHGDLFQIGNCFVFDAVLYRGDLPGEEVRAGEADWVYGSPPTDTKALVVNARRGSFFDKRGVIVVPVSWAYLNPSAEAYVRGRPV